MLTSIDVGGISTSLLLLHLVVDDGFELTFQADARLVEEFLRPFAAKSFGDVVKPIAAEFISFHSLPTFRQHRRVAAKGTEIVNLGIIAFIWQWKS